MNTMNVGRVIGWLLIAQIVAGGLVNAALLGPVIMRPPGFLENAAASAVQVRAAVLIGLASGALSIAIAIAAAPVFWSRSRALALWLLALGTASFTLAVVENSAVMTMLSLSEAYAQAAPAQDALYQAMRITAASPRNWLHYTHLLVGGGMFLIFYTALFRFALIPRVLAAFGLIAIGLQMSAVTLPLLGERVVMLMLVPIGLTHLAVGLFLIAMGFPERSTAPDAGTLRSALT